MIDFSQYPKSAGAYDLGGVHFFLAAKPDVFRRLIARVLLGWTWVDNHYDYGRDKPAV